MAKTTTTGIQIRNDSINGSDINDGYGLYDETNNYSVGNIVLWRAKQYTCKNNVSGGVEGDFSNAPDVSSDWEEINSIMYSVTPSTIQTYDDAEEALEIDTEAASSSYFSLASNEITVVADCTVFVGVTFTGELPSGATRSTSKAVLQIDTGSGYVDVNNTEIYCYHRTDGNDATTGSTIKPLRLHAGDKLRVAIKNNSGANDLQTIPNGCGVNIRTPASGKGEKGDTGAVGPSGDLDWKGAWTGGTANINDTYEYQGSTYVCTVNGTTSNPPSAGRDLVAKKGTDGSGANIVVQSGGSSIPNTPHSTLNFTGGAVATDGGGGVANINVLKNSYILPIWAEENAAISAGSWEWAFGNGANTPSDGGVTIYVPSGYTAAIKAMSLRVGGGTARVEAVVNGVQQGSACDVTISSGQSATNDGFTPVALSNNDYVNFHTLAASGSSGPNVVTMRIEYTKI